MTIPFDEFKRLDMRIGKILSAEPVPDSDKLLKLMVDFGVSGEPPAQLMRQIVAGIAAWYTPEELAGREAAFAFNLEPKVLCGLESQGMILAADAEGRPVLLQPDREVPPGSRVR